MTRDEREALRLEIDRVKRERLARASWTRDENRDAERRRASWRAYYRRRAEARKAAAA